MRQAPYLYGCFAGFSTGEGQVITFDELARLNGYDPTTPEGRKHARYLWEEFQYWGGDFPKPEELKDEAPI